jgi:Ca2+/Na+ antiporter
VAFVVVWIFWRRPSTIREWSQRHPTLTGIAIGFVIVGMALFLLFDPISVLVMMVLALTYAFAAFFDPKTYSKSKPPD